MGLERHIIGKGYIIMLQWNQIQFPEPTLVSSQVPVTLVLGDTTPSFCLRRRLHINVHRHTHTQLKTETVPFFKDQRGDKGTL